MAYLSQTKPMDAQRQMNGLQSSPEEADGYNILDSVLFVPPLCQVACSVGLKLLVRGDGLAQWLERWTEDPKVEGSNPVRSTRKTLSFSESKRLC